MKRDLRRLADERFDLTVIGGGIQGAWIAWDATLRGLSVALVERSDFGSATSANSLKIVHGGLRYLQNGDIRRMRQSIRERSVLMRVAPHLVHPLPVLIPLYGRGLRGPGAMRIALTMTDAIGLDRNRGADERHRLLAGRVLSREECRHLLPGLPSEGLSGAALWYDAQMYDSERLTLAVLRSAAEAGAALGNYVEATRLAVRDGRVIGVDVKDHQTGDDFTIGSHVVVNAAGPWAASLSAAHGAAATARHFGLSKALNVAVPKLFAEIAVGIPSQTGGGQPGRLYFATPWRDHTIIGTAHLPYDGTPEQFAVTVDDIRDFVDGFNTAYPSAGISTHEILHVYAGMLPTRASDSAGNAVLVADHPLVCRDGQAGGPAGLITVTAVKYTTARTVAEAVVDAVFAELGTDAIPCQTDHVRLHGGEIPDLDAFLRDAARVEALRIDSAALRHLVLSYGTVVTDVARLVASRDDELRQATNTDEILRAQVLYAVRHEMALRLTDVLYRRTDVGVTGKLTPGIVRACARWMAAELGWDSARTAAETAAVAGPSIVVAA